MDNGRIVAALAGNPNVGKSSIFNALTGMRQHTGNWAGKTVASAQGTYQYGGKEFLLVDLPGTDVYKRQILYPSYYLLRNLPSLRYPPRRGLSFFPRSKHFSQMENG